jgi:hypothetical protein
VLAVVGPGSGRPSLGRSVLYRRVLIGLVIGLVVAGCGSAGGGAGPAVDADGGGSATTVGRGIPEGAGLSEGSAAVFAAGVVGRLQQEAFYATDVSFLEPVVWPGALDRVAGELDGRVEPVRWAIATFPGETERTWFVSAPLTVAVTGFDPGAGTASVEVWLVTVFARENLGPPETRFVLERAELRWDGGRWLLAGLESAPGPAAALAADQVPSTPAELTAALDDHRLIEPGAGS